MLGLFFWLNNKTYYYNPPTKMYNLAKSFISSASDYLASAFTSNPTSKPEIREYTRDEITEYFSNPEWKNGGYMNCRYFGFMPPDDKLSVQLKLISRLIHHRFITLSDVPGQLFTPIFFNIIHNAIKYKSDLELLDPRNLESPLVANNPYRNGSLYTWFNEIADELNWDTPLHIPINYLIQTEIKTLKIVGDWYNHHPEFTLNIIRDTAGQIQRPTIRDLCSAIFPLIANDWVSEHKISEYTASWQIRAGTPDTLEIWFKPDGYHIDNIRYAKGCYENEPEDNSFKVIL